MKLGITIFGGLMSNQPRHQLVDEVSLSFDPTMNITVKDRKEGGLFATETQVLPSSIP